MIPAAFHSRGMVMWARFALLLSCLVLVCGCGARKERELFGVRYEVDDVVLEGVTRFKKRELLRYLYIGETSWLPLTETYYFNEALVPTDIERIVALYRAYGYPDAEVTAFRILRRERGDVDVLISVREGTPIRIDNITIEWSEGPPVPENDDTGIQAAVEETVTIAPGDPLEVPTLEDTIDTLLLALKERGFPLAEAEAKIAMTEERRAEVRIDVRPGPFARIGDISVGGLRNITLRSVMTEVSFAVGKPFSPSLLSRIEKRVFAMDLFSAAEVSTAQQVVDGKIDLKVMVREAKPQSVKVGVSVAFESARWDQGVRALYTHRNLARTQWRLDTRFRVGYAELPAPYNMQAHGPTLELEPRFTKKGWLERRLVWTAAPAIELGIEEGYQFYTPSTHLGVSRIFAEMILVEVSHHFNFFDFFNISPTLDANRTLLGLDYRDPYLLSYVDVNTVLYLTDQILEPKTGVVLANRYQVAGGALGGHFDFQKITPSVTAYWQMVERVQLALRAETGYIFPYGDERAAPFNMKYYLGGADTVRGWGQRRLAPKTVLCPDDSGQNCRSIPIGGKTAVLANIEVRVRTIKDLFVAAYADMGDVQSGEFVYRPEEWNYSAGGGLRYQSPFGKIRLDAAAKLNDTPLSEGEPGWAFHFGLGEAF